MVLSPKVSRSSGAPTKSSKRPSSNPFSGLNQTEAGISLQPRSRFAAEQMRSAGGKKQTESRKGTSGTFKALKMQRALASVPYGHRNTVKEMISNVQTFDDFSLLPVIKEAIATNALSGLEYVTPTPVQRLAIPALLGQPVKSTRRPSSAKEGEMNQFLLAAETGSGKTLAYLLPTIDAVKRAEAADADIEAYEKARQDEERRNNNPFELEPPQSDEPHPTTGRPRAIILVPTSELVTQVGTVVKSLSHKVKFRSALLSSAYTGRVIRNRLFTPTGVDVVVSTPHLLSSIAESDPNILSRVSHLVIDEADSLLDRSFTPSTSAIVDKATPSLRQLILCSATIPRGLDSYLHRRFPDINRLVTPNLHAIPRRVQLGVMDVTKDPYRGNKDLACAESIWTIGKSAAEQATSSSGELDAERLDVKRILVFVNEREKTQELADYLNSKGIDAVALNRDAPELRQSETLGIFTSATKETVPLMAKNPTTQSDGTNYRPANRSPSQPVSVRRQLPNTKVLVSTDLGSRGIDTVAVRHVILYDVPHSTIDFIHRLGRTGRMGRRGRAIVLVGKGDRGDVVREVREGMFQGQALI
ncbi:MAG: hypothetical protein Q9191_005102 [Dirinaria sp. TL-2023a]